jgi:hypothetical protein
MSIRKLSDGSLSAPRRPLSARGGDVVGPFFNSATGGSTNDVSNYNGTGQTWRVHTFTSSGTFTVTGSNSWFRVLCVGAGASGGENGGNGGQVVIEYAVYPTTGNHTVVVGAGTDSYAGSGGSSSFGSYVSAAGGVGIGSGNTGGDFPIYNGGKGNGGANTTSNSTGALGLPNGITGTSIGYGGGGGGGALNNVPGNGTHGGGNGGNSSRGQNGTANRGGGGGGGQFVNPRHGIGGSGVVIVSYRIA